MSTFLHVLNQLTGQLVDIKCLVPTVNAEDQEDDDSDDEEEGEDQVWTYTYFLLSYLLNAIPNFTPFSVCFTGPNSVLLTSDGVFFSHTG